VSEGEIYGFLGANGAGKTTVLKLIAGLLNPTSGQIEVCGMEHSGNREAILRSIGSLIEVPAFYEHLSATENLEIHLAYMGVQKADIERGVLSR
jgi:ABC-2 type transport system ATP-binding protein